MKILYQAANTNSETDYKACSELRIFKEFKTEITRTMSFNADTRPVKSLNYKGSTQA